MVFDSQVPPPTCELGNLTRFSMIALTPKEVHVIHALQGISAHFNISPSNVSLHTYNTGVGLKNQQLFKSSCDFFRPGSSGTFLLGSRSKCKNWKWILCTSLHIARTVKEVQLQYHFQSIKTSSVLLKFFIMNQQVKVRYCPSHDMLVQISQNLTKFCSFC